MITARRRYWTLAVRHDRGFFPEFGSFVRGEAIAKMSEWRREGVRRIDLKIIASDPDPAAVTKVKARICWKRGAGMTLPAA
jgi:hypothetical protein